MAKVADQLDAIVEKIMDGLKDFQKATVRRIWENADRQRHCGKAGQTSF